MVFLKNYLILNIYNFNKYKYKYKIKKNYELIFVIFADALYELS